MEKRRNKEGKGTTSLEDNKTLYISTHQLVRQAGLYISTYQVVRQTVLYISTQQVARQTELYISTQQLARFFAFFSLDHAIIQRRLIQFLLLQGNKDYTHKNKKTVF